ncbi:MAG: hypothetical protein NT120_00570 [Candidatus Aenigmarchaeota archaeon]|nr:hypothetical protein [Candidatus Aenigmarchaeota archaeon]
MGNKSLPRQGGLILFCVFLLSILAVIFVGLLKHKVSKSTYTEEEVIRIKVMSDELRTLKTPDFVVVDTTVRLFRAATPKCLYVRAFGYPSDDVMELNTRDVLRIKRVVRRADSIAWLQAATKMLSPN